jgi:hypothetical protein
MAEVTIRFRHNAATGKRELIIGYESDSDALPHEHEKDHRALAEQLLGVPLGDDVEGVRVERVQKDGKPVEDEPAREAERQREAARSKGG